VDAHLRYLERDGVTKDGEKGQVYSAERDVEDGRAFLDRGREDRHQFRFIVSAEDGAELSDLRTTTRDLMQQMETDLGTKLNWIAVDHFNTGHPHTHILLRGITEDGKILNIAGDYIAYGIRERASEVVTRELGRQSELEVTKQLEREVDADRFTGLDRMLIAEQRGREFSDLRPDQDMRDTFRQNRALLIEWARKLERMGLATEIEAGKWPSLCCGSLASAATSSRPCTGRWSAKGWRRTAILPAMSCIERMRPGASQAACSTRGLAATRWASGSGC
jgi:type IV secretory pathway VirD2 relaxase